MTASLAAGPAPLGSPATRSMGHHCVMTRRWNGWGDDGDRDQSRARRSGPLEGIVGQGRPIAERAPRRRRRCGPRRPARATTRSSRPTPRTASGTPAARASATGSPCAAASSGGCPMPSGGRRRRPRSATCSAMPGRPAPGSSPTAAARTSSAGCRRPSSARRPAAIRRSSSSTSSGWRRCAAYDETSGLATFGAGVTGPALEAALKARGRMLGHEPQSWEYSTLGGWVATRSSGQRSLGVRSDRGPVRRRAGSRHRPARSSSRRTPPRRPARTCARSCSGSEGRLGIVAEATVRTVPIPDYERTVACVHARTGSAGMAAVRELAERPPAAGDGPPVDAGRDADRPWPSPAGDAGSAWRCAGSGGAAPATTRVCSCSASPAGPGSPRRPAARPSKIVRKHGGVTAPDAFGHGLGRRAASASPTCATRCGMPATPSTRSRPRSTGAGRRSLAAALVQALTPASRARTSGSTRSPTCPTSTRRGRAIYVTYVFRQSPRPEGTHRRWLALKTAASRSIVEHGGTISHQHGVGRDHVPYLARREGRARAWPALRDVAARFDPAGLMDPDVLLGRRRTRRRRERRADRILAIDCGTQSLRALVVDPARRDRRPGPRAATSRTSPPQPGWAEQDPEVWWRALGEASRRVLADPRCGATAWPA